MRILQVNKFHYSRGGADKYYLHLGKMLQENGHQVAYFSMKHPKNLPCSEEKYFISRLSFNEGGFKDKLKTPFRMIYSLEAKRKFNQLLQDFKPDIIHIHNIYHQISPSILDAARHHKIPVVMHLHDYKLICPNYQLFTKGKICEACKPDHYFNCTRKCCFKDSFSKSLLATLEMRIHHSWLKIYKKNINTFIAPSLFMKNKVVEFGWSADKIKVVINPFSQSFINSESNLKNNSAANYFLYFGRLSPEKGLEILIQAAALTGSKIKIAGLGPEEKKLKALAKSLKVEVDFLGFKEGKDLQQLIVEAKGVIIPSIWYENMPLSLLESLSLGKPVLASNIGGFPEIIQEGINGWLFKAGSVEDLVVKIKALDKIDAKEMSQAALDSVKNFQPAKHLKEIENIYQAILK